MRIAPRQQSCCGISFALRLHCLPLVLLRRQSATSPEILLLLQLSPARVCHLPQLACLDPWLRWPVPVCACTLQRTLASCLAASLRLCACAAGSQWCAPGRVLCALALTHDACARTVARAAAPRPAELRRSHSSLRGLLSALLHPAKRKPGRKGRKAAGARGTLHQGNPKP